MRVAASWPYAVSRPPAPPIRRAHRLVSISDDGWTYAIEDSVMWTDKRDVLHDSGWPECLEPRHPGFMDRNHEMVRFSFAEVTADTGDVGWRPVVMVDCGQD